MQHSIVDNMFLVQCSSSSSTPFHVWLSVMLVCRPKSVNPQVAWPGMQQVVWRWGGIAGGPCTNTAAAALTFGSSTIHHQNRAGQSRTGGRRGRRGEKKKKERHHEHDEGGSESCQKMHLNCKLFDELRFVLEAILILQTKITWECRVYVFRFATMPHSNANADPQRLRLTSVIIALFSRLKSLLMPPEGN